MRETEHALSGGLGAVERRGADADESHHFDSQARLESADGGAGRIPQADEPVVHQDAARTAEEGSQTGAQGSSEGDEETQQNHRGACGAAPGSVGEALAGNGDRKSTRLNSSHANI